MTSQIKSRLDILINVMMADPVFNPPSQEETETKIGNGKKVEVITAATKNSINKVKKPNCIRKKRTLNKSAEYVNFTIGQESFVSLGPKRSTSGKNLNKFGYCTRCGIKSSPEWRKNPQGETSLCNACGLNLKKLTKAYSENGVRYFLKTYDKPFKRSIPSIEELERTLNEE
ncbi:hypothetical protein TBLA_0A07280 [Henningerozyma blattae CBS 6284]|uniref:GATA-type domain-containing protein n=1 Tax=Henningerozyma blattae (strain ATCC 34711 / CBS 6284 / DSM 70876 / NBRC 10599 / NRRL Y-10934 / UCD 77-7) TaxID=1071380 RepID=I2GWL5_HENB6|nr:hypothetical protein TBLA_0A07280 [Tetrapisispora blattae CBS 6284]CCH58517.1 hypothetical protein TBLA_0A07280 [Tetrapisispora blattae CBS 6284]